jgi:hypothetical protein
MVIYIVLGIVVLVTLVAGVIVIAQRGRLKKCPYCTRRVRTDATVCPYCTRELPPGIS